MKTNQLNNNHFINSPLPHNPNTTTIFNYAYIVITLNPNANSLSDSLAKKQVAKELVFKHFKELLSRLD